MNKFKSWTIKDIKDTLVSVANKAGISVDGIPITISNRMTSCKGQCRYRIIDVNVKTISFRFAKNLIDGTYPENVVREVIIHEYAHHYINTKTNKGQHHNKLFKETCRMLGISDSTYFNHDSSNKSNSDLNSSFKIECTKCGYIYIRTSLKEDIS